MTINIAVVTSDALVLGCDSFASITTPMINPFDHGPALDGSGEIIKDKEGNFVVPLKGVQQVVTDVMGGVTKMFKIYDLKHTVVAATTAGMGKLNDRSVAAVAYDFFQSVKPPRAKIMTKVPDVVGEFYDFIRAEYEIDQKETGVPEEHWASLDFLVGGHGKEDKFPSIYRIRVKDKKTTCEFEGGKTGMCWAGQADCIEKIIRGYDNDLLNAVEQHAAELLNSHHKEMSETTLRILDTTLKALKVEQMPEGVDTTLPSVPVFKLDWKQFKVGVSYANLPLQEAINFVSFLVFTQAGKQRFAPGLATVGGRTHIGYATRSDGFKMLNEPEFAHTHTGFEYDH